MMKHIIYAESRVSLYVAFLFDDISRAKCVYIEKTKDAHITCKERERKIHYKIS